MHILQAIIYETGYSRFFTTKMICCRYTQTYCVTVFLLIIVSIPSTIYAFFNLHNNYNHCQNYFYQWINLDVFITWMINIYMVFDFKSMVK